MASEPDSADQSWRRGLLLRKTTGKRHHQILRTPAFSVLSDKSHLQATEFCNNANSAISSSMVEYRFDENTGLEDMELAKRYIGDGGVLAYVSGFSLSHTR